jgi:hypothetical protein
MPSIQRRRYTGPAALLIFVLSSVAFPASSQENLLSPVVVFDSFGPGNTYLSSVVWGVSGASTSGGYRGQAEWFLPGISGNLSSVVLATFRSSGSGRSNFYLAQDNGGIPGTILESYLNVQNNPNGLLTLTSAGQPLLQAGTKYWLADEPADLTTVNGWFENNQSFTNGFAFERSQWGWQAADHAASGVFRVSVTPVPEPTAFALIGLGVCLLGRGLQGRFR